MTKKFKKLLCYFLAKLSIWLSSAFMLYIVFTSTKVAKSMLIVMKVNIVSGGKSFKALLQGSEVSLPVTAITLASPQLTHYFVF